MASDIYSWRGRKIKIELREPHSEACYTCHERETYHCHENCSTIKFPEPNILETKLEKKEEK